jgi:hypothetical protein
MSDHPEPSDTPEGVGGQKFRADPCAQPFEDEMHNAPCKQQEHDEVRGTRRAPSSPVACLHQQPDEACENFRYVFKAVRAATVFRFFRGTSPLPLTLPQLREVGNYEPAMGQSALGSDGVVVARNGW